MALIFMAGCATVVLVTAMLTNTPVSGSAGKDYHFNLGNQKSCQENFEKRQDDTHEKKKKKRKGIRKLFCCCR